MSKTRFWHKLTKKSRHRILKKGDMTWGQLAKRYKQPDWCGYPGAMHGIAGCWSLTSEGGTIRSRRDCAGCECRMGRNKAA